MKAHSVRTTSVHRLRRSQVLTLPRPRGLCLRAERGTLWITIDGQPEDIVLDPGQGRVIDGTATVRVSALGGRAVLSATAAVFRPSWHERLQGWFEPSPQGASA